MKILILPILFLVLFLSCQNKERVSNQKINYPTISVRNISLKDSTYVLNAVYNDSYGKQLRSFVARPILLKPLEAIEFVIEDKEDKGGAGASLILEWGGSRSANQLLV